MGLWRNLALINLVNPNALSQDVKNALQARWEYEITHPKKKSGIGGAIGKVVGAIAPVASIATAGLIKPQKAVDAVGDVIHTAGKVAGAVKDAAGDAIHTAGKVAGNLGQSSINVIKETAKGNIGKAISNAANVATLGTVDTTGGKNGIVNIHATKYINAAVGGGTAAPKINQSTSLLPETTTKKNKGLLTQLRKAKGSIGGGSYTEAVKNPLGGSAGKTGR